MLHYRYRPRFVGRPSKDGPLGGSYLLATVDSAAVNAVGLQGAGRQLGVRCAVAAWSTQMQVSGEQAQPPVFLEALQGTPMCSRGREPPSKKELVHSGSRKQENRSTADAGTTRV